MQDEEESRLCPNYIQMPVVQAGRYDCMSEDEIRTHCQPIDSSGPAPAECDRLIALFRDKQKNYLAARHAAGLTSFDKAAKTTLEQWHKAMKNIATTPATTFAGLAVKLRILVEGFRVGRTDFDEAIAQSALADAERLAGKGGAS